MVTKDFLKISLFEGVVDTTLLTCKKIEKLWLWSICCIEKVLDEVEAKYCWGGVVYDLFTVTRGRLEA